MLRSRPILIAFVVVQVLCASVFLWDLFATILGTRNTPLSWRTRESLEIAASIGLILGVAFGIRTIFLMRADARKDAQTIRSFSGALTEVIGEQFLRWDLTKAEEEVAWLTIKGFTIAEISALRGTKDGTIKAQSTAIYRKAGVNSRAQLLALFVDDMIAGLDDSPGSNAGESPASIKQSAQNNPQTP